MLIHHISKGNQSGKVIMDVGAGAGSQSRATDTHLVLRPHEEDDVVVPEAVVRSWAPILPKCLRWAFPVWTPADDLDPTQLRSDKPRRRSPPEAEEQPGEEPAWTTERLVCECVTATPQTRVAILAGAQEVGLSKRQANLYLQDALSKGLVDR